MATPDPQKVALAQSVAVHGSQGPAAYAAQQADLGAQSSAALDQASKRAGLIGAPEQFLKQQAAAVSEPYSTTGKQVSANSNALNSYLGSMNGAHNNYLSELSAAIPLAQAKVDQGAQGNNLNDMLKLLSFKNEMEDRDWTKQQRTAQLDKDTLDKKNVQVQQQAFNSILNHPNADFRDTGIAIINGATDLPSALLALQGVDDKKLQKSGINRDDLRRTIVQYFDPETYGTLPPQRIAATNTAPVGKGAPAPGKKKKDSLFGIDWLKVGSGI